MLMNEINSLVESKSGRNDGLVDFLGAYYLPESGQFNIALEYMDGGSMADALAIYPAGISEFVLAPIMASLVQGLITLHKHRHLVHRYPF